MSMGRTERINLAADLLNMTPGDLRLALNEENEMGRELHLNGVHTECPSDCLTLWNENGDDAPADDSGYWIVTGPDGTQLDGPFIHEEEADDVAEAMIADGDLTEGSVSVAYVNNA